MNLDKFIEDNIDDILDNPGDYIFDNITNRKPFQNINNNDKKKVSFDKNPTFKSTHIFKSTNKHFHNTQHIHNLEPLHNQLETEYDYYEKYFDVDIYDEDYDDFGYIYKKNNSDSESDTESDKNSLDNYDNEPDEFNETNSFDKMYKFDEPNEDDYSQDIIGDLYQDLYQNQNQKIDIFEMFKKISGDKTKLSESDQISQLLELNSNKPEITEDIEKLDDGYYFINLINIFVKYYNNKFDRTDNFFSGIKNNHKDTSNQMELFFDAIMEYKIVKKTFGLDDKKCMEMIYLDSSDTKLPNEEILNLFSNWENQIYMLDLGIKRYISPSLLICLNYLFENKIDGDYWDIYNLKNV